MFKKKILIELRCSVTDTWNDAAVQKEVVHALGLPFGNFQNAQLIEQDEWLEDECEGCQLDEKCKKCREKATKELQENGVFSG